MVAFENIVLRVQRQTLLDGAGLHVGEGEKAVVRGPSGCGKSSLLKCAVGVLPLAAGRVRIGGETLDARTVAQIRARVAYIGQEPVLGAPTVREALLLPFTFSAHRTHRPDEGVIAGLLERVHLPPGILGKPCNLVSGGEKQRIAICRALLLGKTLFLADEATSALDPASRAAVMAELFRPGITLLSVSHDPGWIGACDRVFGIAGQRIVEEAA